MTADRTALDVLHVSCRSGINRVSGFICDVPTHHWDK